MSHNDSIKKFFAGIFFLFGILLIIGVVFVIGIEKGLTQPKFQVEVLFKSVGGLVEGSNIRISGVNVGVVGKIDFLERKVQGRDIKVILHIFSKYRHQLEKSTTIAIKNDGVLGEKSVEISEDPNKDPLNFNEPVFGEQPLDVNDLAEALEATALSLRETTDGVNAMINEFKFISIKTKRILNRAEQRLVDGTLFKVF